jgi:hypothetical protein
MVHQIDKYAWYKSLLNGYGGRAGTPFSLSNKIQFIKFSSRTPIMKVLLNSLKASGTKFYANDGETVISR